MQQDRILKKPTSKRGKAVLPIRNGSPILSKGRSTSSLHFQKTKLNQYPLKSHLGKVFFRRGGGGVQTYKFAHRLARYLTLAHYNAWVGWGEGEDCQ